MIYCKKCETNKEADEFYSSVISKDGLTGECKECTKKRVKENRAANALIELELIYRIECRLGKNMHKHHKANRKSQK